MKLKIGKFFLLIIISFKLLGQSIEHASVLAQGIKDHKLKIF